MLADTDVRATEDPIANAAEVALRGVTKQFPDGVTAVSHVDVALPAGEITVLVGPSGCGKTTILRLIAGFESPTTGTVEIDGRAMNGVDPRDRSVAMVFQDYALYPNKTACANIEFPLRVARVPAHERRARVARIAEQLRITEQLGRKPAQLSGGQKQRVGIGRALVRDPRVLLMDEPLSNLDAQLRGDMRAEILTLQRELGVTMVYVTHDQTEALTLADRLIVLCDGRLEQTGTPIEVYSRPATTFVAKFVGGMNLVSGHAFDDCLVTESGHRIRLPLSLRPRSDWPVVVGVRPEDLDVGDGSDDDLSFAGEVQLSEFLGTQQLVHVGVGPLTLRAHLPAAPPATGRLRLRAPSHAIHLFSAVSGLRLSPQ